jgi:hypothetical protein
MFCLAFFKFDAFHDLLLSQEPRWLHVPGLLHSFG